MNIKDIKWPIYAIGEDTKIHSEYNVTFATTYDKVTIIDNKNLEGDTLGRRRLNLDPDDLYRFNKTLFILPELVDYTRTKKIKDRLFIDSSGVIFIYDKKETVKLIWRKTTNIEKFSSFVLLSVEGLCDKFEIPNNYWKMLIDANDYYLGLLVFPSYYIVYDVSLEPKKDTWRKV